MNEHLQHCGKKPVNNNSENKQVVKTKEKDMVIIKVNEIEKLQGNWPSVMVYKQVKNP